VSLAAFIRQYIWVLALDAMLTSSDARIRRLAGIVPVSRGGRGVAREQDESSVSRRDGGGQNRPSYQSVRFGLRDSYFDSVSGDRPDELAPRVREILAARSCILSRPPGQSAAEIFCYWDDLFLRLTPSEFNQYMAVLADMGLRDCR
jgi:hypothetical protein